jgi:glycosyltransferase involved in cell wall biosynthesis
MTREDLTVSIVIPAKNEKGNIENLIKRIPQFGKSLEIIFVEGGSTDGTLEEIKRVAEIHPDKNIKWAAQKCKGKRDAARKGFEMATGDVLMILDADLSVPPEELPKFYEMIKSGEGQFINGTRFIYPMEKGAMRFLNYWGNKFFTFLLSWIIGQKITDTLCGTKVLLKSDYEKIKENRKFFGDFDPFGDFDLLFGAAKLGLKIQETPVHYKARTYGKTNISRFRHGWLLLKMTIFAAKKFKFK